MLVQVHDKVSDEEAVNRFLYDIRWKGVLEIGMDGRPFVKSMLQLFRSQLLRGAFYSLQCSRVLIYLPLPVRVRRKSERSCLFRRPVRAMRRSIYGRAPQEWPSLCVNHIVLPLVIRHDKGREILLTSLEEPRQCGLK